MPERVEGHPIDVLPSVAEPGRLDHLRHDPPGGRVGACAARLRTQAGRRERSRRHTLLDDWVRMWTACALLRAEPRFRRERIVVVHGSQMPIFGRERTCCE